MTDAHGTSCPTCHHLHTDDHPRALHLVGDLLRGREIEGFTTTEYGAWVDWEALLDSYLSSTEIAVVHIARGLSIAERQGGFGLMERPVVEAFGSYTEAVWNEDEERHHNEVASR